MGSMTNVSTVLVWKPEGKKWFGRRRHERESIL